MMAEWRTEEPNADDDDDEGEDRTLEYDDGEEEDRTLEDDDVAAAVGGWRRGRSMPRIPSRPSPSQPWRRPGSSGRRCWPIFLSFDLSFDLSSDWSSGLLAAEGVGRSFFLSLLSLL